MAYSSGGVENYTRKPGNNLLNSGYKRFPMTELEKIFVTSAVTILGGLFLYVIGQLLSKFFIDPAHELKKAIGEVRYNLAFHAPIIHTPASRKPERSQKAYEALMKSSCDLLVQVNAIPFYSRLSCLTLGFLPSKQAIVGSARLLRGLTTYVHETDPETFDSINTINETVAYIEKKLGLKTLG